MPPDTPVSVTLNEHDALRDWASLVAQLTFVLPSANDVPVAGLHVVVMGAAPPETVGDG